MSWARLIGPRRSLVLMCPVPVVASRAGAPHAPDEAASPPPFPSWTPLLDQAHQGGNPPQQAFLWRFHLWQVECSAGGRAQVEWVLHRRRQCAAPGSKGEGVSRVRGVGGGHASRRGGSARHRIKALRALSTKCLDAVWPIGQTFPRTPQKSARSTPCTIPTPPSSLFRCARIYPPRPSYPFCPAEPPRLPPCSRNGTKNTSADAGAGAGG